MHLERRIGWASTILGLVVILVATLTPLPGGDAAAATTPFWCLVCGSRGGIDVILNILLFVPFATGLRLTGQPWRRVVVLAALLSIFVEAMQAGVVVGRDPSLSDLLTNTTGGALGAALGPYLRAAVLPRQPVAAALAVVWAVVWLSILLGTIWLLRPWGPSDKLRIGWGEALPGYGVFTGRVLTAEGDFLLRPGNVPDSLRLPERLARGDVRLGFDAVVGEQKSDWAPIVALLGKFGAIGAVYEVRDDLVLKLPTQAERFRLRSPALRLDRGRPDLPAEPIRVTAGSRGRTLWIASSYGGERRYRELELSPNFGWSLLIPFEYGYGSEIHLLTSLWIVGLLLPLGYWARRARSSRWSRKRLAFGLVVLVVFGLGLLPWLAGYPPVHRSEWVAAAAGLLLGWAAASRVIYLAERCPSRSASESFSS